MQTELPVPRPLSPDKFRDPAITAKGERRATVTLRALRTLWFNTGTLCNLTCANCYIESSPSNDRLVYLSAAEVREYLDEIARDDLATGEIGFTGGEPFMNPELLQMLEDCLSRGFRVLVLTNAMRPMMRCGEGLLALREKYGDKLVLRVSLDHYSQALHEKERGRRSWAPALEGLKWLAAQGFSTHVAGRTGWGEPAAREREGFGRLFAAQKVPLNSSNPQELVLFPEMDAQVDVPEITEGCWDILHVRPESLMCASSRMIVKRKGAARPAVVACTLLPYDPRFELGRTLAESSTSVALNHPHCAKFCVLGGGSCSVAT
jgi:uncharacterized Fe-S cluster-containing radical SAM superfamily protein